MIDDQELAMDADALLVAWASKELGATDIASLPPRLEARILMRKAQVIRTMMGEKAALAPISVGVPGAIAAVALAAIGALSEWVSPTTALGVMASGFITALLLAAFAASMTMLVSAWRDIRHRA